MRRLLTSGSRPSALWLLFGAAILLAAATAASAQQISREGETAASLPSSNQFAEDFDAGSLQGWHFSCEYALVSTQAGRALQTSGGGHAIWNEPGSLGDFALQFRYGYAKGAGDVIFRITETAQGMECYCLKLEPHGISLVRRWHTADQQFPEKTLAAVPAPLQPQQWYDFTIQAVGGQIDVAIGQQQVLSCLDPAPLARGACGLGVIANSGSVLYDDVDLFDLAPIGQAASAAQTATTVNWP
jgi:hypothetical protein